MKAKIILVISYLESIMPKQVERVAERFRKSAEAWAVSKTDHVLGILVPEGCKVTGYAVPEEALVEFLPEVVMRVEQDRPADSMRLVRGKVPGPGGVPREIEIPVDEETYRKVAEGKLTGYSMGGDTIIHEAIGTPHFKDEQ